ncbi:YegS/Rv2252/BmrU family lipid kinase [Flavonifractor sp. An100]|uniref:diacylglycerol/lipid kinase family protein n=1 Tax=Flavonifractor sp. An100 TaxID=1965538 RepID=UPI000B3A66F8|nr:YegS/Rv2252/BmrU family lipid kinase [Flavonifractor sp. An100]OUQ76034.1 BmrU protein [Flavonifractor sp. An100]
MRHLFIINPAAGRKGSTAHLEGLLSELSVPHEKIYTKGAGDAREIARQAAATGEEVRLYACGGDGTLNEVVNGAAGFPNAAVTCVPKGTGNDFLKLFGPEYRQLFYDLEGLAVGPQTPFDLMDCNGHLGLDVVCAGVDARIAAGVHRYKDLPGVSGKGAYVLSLLEQVLLRGIACPMEVEVDGKRWQGETAVLCVCNGRHYGGGFMPVPEAMPDDGILDVLLIPKVSLLTFARLVGKYAKGRYRDYLQLIQDFHTTQITYRSREELVTVVDGEVLRDTQFTLRLSEKKVNFFYPAQARYR